MNCTACLEDGSDPLAGRAHEGIHTMWQSHVSFAQDTVEIIGAVALSKLDFCNLS